MNHKDAILQKKLDDILEVMSKALCNLKPRFIKKNGT